MRPRTLRGRLTAAAVARGRRWPSPVLAVCAQLLVAQQLRSSLDSSLRRRAVDVARLSVSAPALLTAPGALEAHRRPGASSRSRCSTGAGASWRARSPSAPSCCRTTRWPPTRCVAGAAASPTCALGGEPLRLYAAPLPEDGGPGGRRRRARRLEHDRHRARRCTASACCSCSPGSLAAGVGGARAAVLTRRGLRPLARMSAAAAEIERTGDASRRLPDPRADGRGRRARRARSTGCSPRSTPRACASGASWPTPATSCARRSRRWPATSSSSRATASTPRCWPTCSSTPQRLQRLVDDLLALERESAGAARPIAPCASTARGARRWRAATAVRVERLRRR